MNSLQFFLILPRKIKKSLIKLIQGLLTKNPSLRIDINDGLFDEWYSDNSTNYADPKDYVIKEDMKRLHMFNFENEKKQTSEKRHTGLSVSPKKPRNITTTGTIPSFMKPTSSATLRTTTNVHKHLMNKSSSVAKTSKFKK